MGERHTWKEKTVKKHRREHCLLGEGRGSQAQPVLPALSTARVAGQLQPSGGVEAERIRMLRVQQWKCYYFSMQCSPCSSLYSSQVSPESESSRS